MTKAAFDKIAAGLEDAIDHARVTNQDEEAVAIEAERVLRWLNSLNEMPADMPIDSIRRCANRLVSRTPPASDVSEAMITAEQKTLIERLAEEGELDGSTDAPAELRAIAQAVIAILAALSTPEQETND